MQLWSQNQTAFAVAAVVMILVVVLFLVRVGTRKYGKKIDLPLAEDLAKGDCEAAAERELKAGRLSSAYDLFVRAQQPMRAAQIAVRQGRLKDAAELLEKAGSRRRAADLYKQVGMTLKAEALLAEEQRVAKEREEQKAALRQRLQQSPEDEEDIASLDRTPAPSPKRPSPTPAPAPLAPAPAKPDLSEVAPSPAAPELDLGAEAKPATPSLFGLQALMDETAQKAASQALALAATQASMASVASAATSLIPGAGEAPPPAEVTHDDAKAAAEPLALGDVKPPAAGLSPGEGQPLAAELSFGGAKPAKDHLLTDSDPSLQAVASPPPAIVEGLPEPTAPSGRTTPRTPFPVAGPSIGAYRMVRPSEPEVFTPPPQVKTPLPQRTRRPSGELGSGERRQPTPFPTPRPRLSLAAKPVTGEPSLPRSRTPSPETPSPDGPAPKTPSPGPGAGPKGTILGIGRR